MKLLSKTMEHDLTAFKRFVDSEYGRYKENRNNDPLSREQFERLNKYRYLKQGQQLGFSNITIDEFCKLFRVERDKLFPRYKASNWSSFVKIKNLLTSIESMLQSSPESKLVLKSIVKNNSHGRVCDYFRDGLGNINDRLNALRGANSWSRLKRELRFSKDSILSATDETFLYRYYYLFAEYFDVDQLWLETGTIFWQDNFKLATQIVQENITINAINALASYLGAPPLSAEQSVDESDVLFSELKGVNDRVLNAVKHIPISEIAAKIKVTETAIGQLKYCDSPMRPSLHAIAGEFNLDKTELWFKASDPLDVFCSDHKRNLYAAKILNLDKYLALSKKERKNISEIIKGYHHRLKLSHCIKVSRSLGFDVQVIFPVFSTQREPKSIDLEASSKLLKHIYRHEALKSVNYFLSKESSAYLSPGESLILEMLKLNIGLRSLSNATGISLERLCKLLLDKVQPFYKELATISKHLSVDYQRFIDRYTQENATRKAA